MVPLPFAEIEGAHGGKHTPVHVRCISDRPIVFLSMSPNPLDFVL